MPAVRADALPQADRPHASPWLTWSGLGTAGGAHARRDRDRGRRRRYLVARPRPADRLAYPAARDAARAVPPEESRRRARASAICTCCAGTRERGRSGSSAICNAGLRSDWGRSRREMPPLASSGCSRGAGGRPRQYFAPAPSRADGASGSGRIRRYERRGQLPRWPARSALAGRLAAGRLTASSSSRPADQFTPTSLVRVPLLASCETDVINGRETCVRVGACTRSQRGRRDSLCPIGAVTGARTASKS